MWTWLIGAFLDASLRVYRGAETAHSFLVTFRPHLSLYGLCTVAEIFDNDAPFSPRGVVAQAWSVAEVLQVWQTIQIT